MFQFSIYPYQSFTLRTPSDELVSIERINEKITIEENILRKQQKNIENSKVFIRYLSKLVHITEF